MPRNCHIETGDAAKVIRCLRKIMNHKSRNITLDMRNVVNFPFETYITICAQSEKVKESGRMVTMNFNSKSSLRVMLERVNNERGKTYHQHIVGNDSLFIQRANITPEITGVIAGELRRIGIKDYYELNTLATEIIGNAIEHGILGRNITWWMYHHKNKDTVKMVFVDMGTGVIRSYRRAGIGRFTPAPKLLLDALKGNVGSSTKEPNRGRGLPQMHKMVTENFISNFILITNTVTLRYKNGKYTTETHPDFVGTYYSWTVNKENFIKWQTWLTSQKNTAQL